jgi:hypothetical protein
MSDNKEKYIGDVREVTLDDLIKGITMHEKLTLANAKIEALQIAGDRLAFLMLNGSTSEIKKALWEWRELNPKKDERHP